MAPFSTELAATISRIDCPENRQHLMLLASLLSEEELSDGADSTIHKAAIAALEKLYKATDRPELAKKWLAKP